MVLTPLVCCAAKAGRETAATEGRAARAETKVRRWRLVDGIFCLEAALRALLKLREAIFEKSIGYCGGC